MMPLMPVSEMGDSSECGVSGVVVVHSSPSPLSGAVVRSVV